MRSLLARSGSVSLLLVALGIAAEAQTVKLNGPLAQPSVGDVTDYLLSPDGAWVVFRPNQAGNAYELFSAPADGAGPIRRLNDPLAPGANVGGTGINIFGAGSAWDYGVSSTARVVYLVDQNADNVDELYSVPVDRSASPVRLNGNLAAGADVFPFWISPDGQHVVYRAKQLATTNLWRAPIDGSAPATVFTPGLEVASAWISPDGSMAAFTVWLPSGRQQLYSVPTDASSAPILLGTTQPPINFGVTAVVDLRFSDDNTHVVFFQVFDEDGLEDADLFAVPVDGSHSPWILSLQPLSPYELTLDFDGAFRVAFHEGNDLVCVDLDGTQRKVIDTLGWTPQGDLVLSPDGTRVVFAARMGGSRSVFQAPIDGSQSALQLSGSGTASVGLVEVVGPYVVFSRDTSLYRVPLLGGQPQLLLNPAPYDNNTYYLVHPGGQDIVFRSEGGLTGVSQLFTVPLDASSLPRQLSAEMTAAGDVTNFSVGADGAFVVYRADQDNNETFELYGVPFAGGSVQKYNDPMAAGPVLGDVHSFLVTSDEERAVYRADEALDEAHGLYASRVDGRGASHSLTAGLSEDCSVFTGWGIDPTGTRAAYLYAQSPGSAAGWLYSATLARPSTPLELEPQTGLALHAQTLVFDSTGTRVFYRKERGLFAPFSLRTARLDAARSAKSLNPPSGDVQDFRVSPDGSLVVYLSDQDLAGVFELYRVGADGSPAATKLSGTLGGSFDVTGFEFAPDGLNVAFLADSNIDQQFELSSVPSDGSSQPVQISGPLVSGGDVTGFAVTLDGQYVVYRADQLVDQQFQLFRAPIGGGAVVPLTPLPAGTSQVQTDFALTADGQVVLYRANPNGVLVYELFRVPADGSAGPVQLSGNLVAGGSVNAFALAPDQTTVVYLADERVNNLVEIHGVPLAGGPSVLLHQLALGDVTSFKIASDSSRVCYLADANQDEVFELFSAPLDGSRPPERLNGTLPGGGDVQSDFAALGGGRTVYRADQEQNDVLELFTSFRERGPRGAATPTQMRTVVR